MSAARPVRTQAVPPGKSLLKKSISFLAVAAALAARAEAADAPAAAADPARSESTLDTVVVTGTRTAGRTVRQSAAPIDVLAAGDLKDTGKSNLLEALRTLLPSFNLPGATNPDLASIVRGAQLRSLDPAYTLVLVNGKRRHTTAVVSGDGFPGSVWVDLALIPVAAIDRVEVLRDGASAIYGSDAIAGVINVILKSDNSGGQVSAETGKTYKGDGGTGTFRGHLAMPIGASGFVDLALDQTHQSLAVRNFALQPAYLSYPAIDANGNPVKLGPNNSLPAGAQPNPKEATRDPNPWRNSGVPPYTTTAFSANAGYGFNDALSAYGFVTYAHRDARSPQNFRLPAAIFANNPGLLSIYPDGFTPEEATNEEDYSATGGIKGEAAGWQWDASVTAGRDRLDIYTQKSANYSLSYPGGALIYGQELANLDLKRSFDTGWFAAPVDLAAGGEFQHEHYQSKAGSVSSWIGTGASSLVGILPADTVDTTRNSRAVYAGASTNLLPRWFVDVAARYEDHSDFGSVSTGRLTTRYELGDAFAVRATISNGFHAPALVTQSYSNTLDMFGVTRRLAPPTSAPARALGASPLQPEKSRNYSLGFTADPLPWLHAAVDAYQIDVDNRLGASSSIGFDTRGAYPIDASGTQLTAAQLASINALLAKAGVVPSGPAYFVNYFVNAGDTRTRGVDVTLEATTKTRDLGRFRWTLAANLNTTSLTGVAPIPAALQGLPNITLLNQSAIYDLIYRAPRQKVIGGVHWDLDGWSADLRGTWYGRLRRLGAGNVDYYQPSAFVADLSLARDFGNGVSVALGANNLFDRDAARVPDYARSATSKAQYVGAWDNSGPIGLGGGYYYGRVSYSF
jgi:iron complex outermembrane receptor protein